MKKESETIFAGGGSNCQDEREDSMHVFFRVANWLQKYSTAHPTHICCMIFRNLVLQSWIFWKECLIDLWKTVPTLATSFGNFGTIDTLSCFKRNIEILWIYISKHNFSAQNMSKLTQSNREYLLLKDRMYLILIWVENPLSNHMWKEKSYF